MRFCYRIFSQLNDQAVLSGSVMIINNVHYAMLRDNGREGVHYPEFMEDVRVTQLPPWSPLHPNYGRLQGRYPAYTMVTCQRNKH